MDASQVPDLEELDEQQARQFLTELFTDLSAEAEYATRHEDYVMENAPVRRTHQGQGHHEGVPEILRR